MKTEATHYIRCFESVGGGRKRLLFQECILLGYCGNGKAKVRVLRGVRGGNGGNVAYIDKHRLINMYIDNKDDKNTPKIPPNTYDAKHNTNVTNLL
jgi:hypothetical protein